MEQHSKLPQNHMVPKIGLTYKSQVPFEQQPRINRSRDAYEILMLNWDQDTLELQETFVVLMLSTSKRVTGLFEMSTGAITGTTVDLKLIFAGALLARAHSIILAHNHPSLKTEPSQSDIKMTEMIVEAGKLLTVEVLDHIIITPSAYFSFRDEGLL
ncbi:JAB domain-containing protein [Sphingobacterium siyangense]|uniref:JAB domain-containing protein n=1 Tax=Sphingobacterium siyangense TaxID=459529 RepID=UPI002FDCEAA7